ncbi:MAG: S6e family ribosomal protein [Candidatus Diapherotrites archaeon]|nr:30S ribosomal protein S6e [Candidatus Micrarchaeota archaeon]MBU1940010.1 30S ribosomal protein S6e [Candidatus Micrarchaeota archaeon]
MHVVISDPKTGKGYKKTVENAKPFMDKRVGDEVSLGIIGLEGYSAKITGGSDKQGFPMKGDLPGTARKRVFVVTERKSGKRERISMRGSVISGEIQQVNLVVTKHGGKKLDDLIQKEGKEEKISAKEEAVLTAKKGIEDAKKQEAGKDEGKGEKDGDKEDKKGKEDAKPDKKEESKPADEKKEDK